MAPRSKGPVGHTGRTNGGNIRDVKVERIDTVTIYKRGNTYSLYYRESGRTVRRRVDGNLAVARATAAKVAASLGEHRPSPLGFSRTTPQALVAGYLDYVENVQKLAWRTQDRYRAALERFVEFCEATALKFADTVDGRTVEDFVRWLRRLGRTRNGASAGKRQPYKVGGIRFILSTCRTAFNWAGRRRMLPPYAENPFSGASDEHLNDPDGEDEGKRVFTPEQERAFFAACSPWQRTLFLPLATYGLRVGELTHLLVEDIDFDGGLIQIRSKPELFWRVKTSRRRNIPLTSEMRILFESLIGGRRTGFVFLNEQYFNGTERSARQFSSPSAFREHLQAVADAVAAVNPAATDRQKRRAVITYCRPMGQIPEKRVRNELMKLTRRIGCPEFTRAHDLRHLFSSRAQEQGINPLLVQEILGHTSLDMTWRYTHIGVDAKREAMEQLKRPRESE